MKNQREGLTPDSQVKLISATFEVKASMPMIRGLRAFLDNNFYKYQESAAKLVDFKKNN